MRLFSNHKISPCSPLYSVFILLTQNPSPVLFLVPESSLWFASCDYVEYSWVLGHFWFHLLVTESLSRVVSGFCELLIWMAEFSFPLFLLCNYFHQVVFSCFNRVMALLCFCLLWITESAFSSFSIESLYASLQLSPGPESWLTPGPESWLTPRVRVLRCSASPSLGWV